MIERLGTSSQSFFAQTRLLRDRRNHCVPIYDSFADPLEPHVWSYIVTPVRERHIPTALHRIKDVVLLLNSLLEVRISFFQVRSAFMTVSFQGLAFLHENGVTRW